MNNQTTYALLMRSEDKGRDLAEAAVYAICVLSAVFAIWQFAQQPVTLMSDRPSYSAVPQLSHHQIQRAADRKS
jgi:hypothetical protein